MHVPDVALFSLASLTKRAPRFRGLGKAYRALNSVLVGCGATPIVNARMKDGTTMRVDLRTHTELDAFYRGEYDPELLALVLTILDPATCFLDVGANVGFYSVAVAHALKRSGAGGLTVAFEPVESNHRRLVENLSANGLLDCARTLQLALSNHSGEATITLREDFARGGETGNAAIAIDPEFDRGFSTTRVKLARLDDLWPQISRPARPVGMIKLDIEGHEDCALEGARSILETYRPAILMEVNKPYFRARVINLDERFSGLFPPDYLMFHELRAEWITLKSFGDCRELDNVFVLPAERLSDPRYTAFGRR